MTEAERSEWHLDRKFSVALIMTIVVQIGSAAWFASKTDSRVAALEQRYLEQQALIAANRQFQVEQRIRVWDRVRAQGDAQNQLRAEMAGISARLDYITRALDRLTLMNDQRIRDERRDGRAK